MAAVEGLLIVDTAVDTIARGIAARADDRLPTSRVAIIDAGHFVREEAPEEYPSIIAFVTALGLEQIDQRLTCIKSPTLVIQGDNDLMIPMKLSHLLAGLIPEAQIRTYSDAGHGFLFQYPIEVAADVNAFLRREEGTVPS